MKNAKRVRLFLKMDRLIDEFISYISSEKGLSQNTTQAYLRDLTRFYAYLKNRGLEDIQKVDEETIIAHLAELKTKNFESSSIARALIALKVYFRFLKRENFIERNPAYYLDNPKLWQTIPNILSIEEIELVFKKPIIETEEGCRSLAIMEVLYGTGIRVSELVSLNLYDVSDTFLKVKGKGKKERLTPLGSRALLAIDRYLNCFRSFYDSDEEKALFVTSRGTRINRIMVWKMIKQYVKLAGISKNISPHSLRHSFATHLIDNGAEIRVIQEMMGHQNIGSTDRYMHMSHSKLQEAFYAFHPR